MYKLFMALRYLRAHKIIYFSIVGVTVGIMAMVVVTSLMGGFSQDMRSRIRGMQAHIVVIPADKNIWITDYDAIAADFRKIPGVRGVSPRLEYEAWLGRQGVYRDVRLVGIVPESERTVSELPAFFQKGGKRVFSCQADAGYPTKNPGVVVGRELGVTDTVGLITARQSTTPILCVKDFDVVGGFRSGMVEYDSGYLFADLSAAQEFLQVNAPPRANVIAVALNDYERDGKAVRTALLDALHARVPCSNPANHASSYFGNRCGLYKTQTWEQSRRILLQAVEVEKGMMYILLSLVVVVAGFNIVAIYTLVVRAKTRDIGILRALGGTEGGVTSIFLLSGGLCGFLGSIFGVLLGLLIATNLNEILDFIRVFSRELNRMGLEGERALNSVPRGSTIVSAVFLAGALAALVANWLALYKDRIRHPWIRMVAAALLLGAAAWFSTGWMLDYLAHDHYDASFKPGHRAVFTGIIVAIWTLFCVAWRLLAGYRRRPGWVFFGFGSSIFMGASALGVFASFAIAVGILIMRPELGWPGLELFSRKIYYIDRVPVFIDYSAIAYIMAWTLVVSFICSIYPALRAAAANPVEAIRDE